MPKKLVDSTTVRPKQRPALTAEARENQMIALAMDAAEEQLRNGTASSQVITHFLRLGTEKEKLEREKLEKENKLLVAKTQAIDSAKEIERLYSEALKAMRSYQPTEDESNEIFRS